MLILLNIALVLQIASGLFWTLTIAMMQGSGGLGVLALMLMVFAVQAAGFVVGGFAAWRLPDHRNKARWALALPFVFWFLPGLVKIAAGGHLSDAGLALMLGSMLLALLGACLFVPARVAAVLPAFLFRSRFVNSLVLAGPALGWLLLVGILVWVFGVEGESTSRTFRHDSTGYALASTIVIAALFVVALGAGSLFSSTWGWLGIWSGVDGACRKLHIAQIVVALPGVLIGALVLAFLLSQN